MGKHIQGPDGKMKGSIGSGKTKIPTAAKKRPAGDKVSPQGGRGSYADALAAYQAAAESSPPRVRCDDVRVGDIVLVRNPYYYEPAEIVAIDSHRFNTRWLITVRSAGGSRRMWVNSAGSMPMLHRADDSNTV